MRSTLRTLAIQLFASRRNRLFSLAVVVTLALGLAPNCVVFAILDSIYFRPLPYPAQERLALANLAHRARGTLDELDGLAFGEAGRVRAFESVAAYRGASFDLNAGNRPERVAGQVVTPDFFRTLGVLPSLGRSFRADEGRRGAPRVIVISDRTWKDYFGGRPDIIGLAVRVDAAPATVVGVMPARFSSFMEGRAARMWAPMPLEEGASAPGERAGNVIARLASGASLDGARLELEAAYSTLARRSPEFYRDRKPALRDFRGSLFGGLGPGIRMLAVIVGLLLVIACGNAANLLLARGADRSREMAIRTALGARRARLVGEMLAGSLGLALAGNVLGLLIAFWGTRLLWASTAPMFTIIGVESIPFGGRVLVFSVLLTLLTTVLFGVVPALRATTSGVTGILAHAAPADGRQRRRTMSRALVVSQVVLCVFTMVGTTLVIRSFAHFSRVSANPGFRPEGLLVAGLPVPAAGSPRFASRLDVMDQAQARVAAMPGVERVGVVDAVPFLESGAPMALHRRAAGAGEEAGERVDADVRRVGGEFFAVMSIPLLQGRFFSPTDGPLGLPVVIVSDRLARTAWNGTSPIGDRLLVDGVWREVVGVVGSTIQPSPFRPAAREAFVPYRQAAPSDLQLLVRSNGRTTALASGVRRQIAGIDPDQPVANLRTLERALDDMMTPFRLILVLMVIFGTIALVLSAVGLYGVIAHDVSRRTREIGVRMAVGAARADVVRMVLRDGLRLASVGLAVGMLFGAGLGKILPSQIFSALSLSLVHYVAVALVWLAIALVACLVPAQRAAAVDPMSSLRCE